MRQAGRYLPEYRALKAKHDFATMTRTAEIAAEVTLQPLRRFPLDAAILFSDIMTPLEGMGVGLSFDPGPVIAEPVRTLAQVEALRPFVAAEAVPFVLDAVRMVRAELPPERALIGFAGAPFTLLCYLVTGSGSKEYAPARILLQREPQTAERLLAKLADAMGDYLAAQAAAGAQALMLFESWAGLLDAPTYARFARPAARRAADLFRQRLGGPARADPDAADGRGRRRLAPVARAGAPASRAPVRRAGQPRSRCAVRAAR
jgi:uroporphyrinogen decarboxylase